MKIKLKAYLVICMFLFSRNIGAQMMLTQEDAVNRALKNSPVIQSAQLQVNQQKHLQGASFNLANPDFTIESPSGQFMTVGFLQSFEFPSVYIKQGQLAKANTALAMQGKILTETEIIQQIKSVYLDLQYYTALEKKLEKKDSLFFNISQAAERQFNAGQIDFVTKTYAATQFGEAHNFYLQNMVNENASFQKLQIYTGITENFNVSEINKIVLQQNQVHLLPDSALTSSTPMIQYYAQMNDIASRSLSLEKNKALPGFSIGYLNQAGSNTPTALRIRAGLNFPLWFWQYSASIKAAKAYSEASSQNLLAQQQSMSIEMQQTRNDIEKYKISLNYYEGIGLKQAEDLISASQRMFESGETKYIPYLQTISDAIDIQLNYLETLKNYNQSVIHLYYLTGQK